MRPQEELSIAVVRRFIDGAINGRDPAVIDETWSDDLLWHGGSLGTFEQRRHSRPPSRPTQRARGAACTSKSTRSSRAATRSCPDAEHRLDERLTRVSSALSSDEACDRTSL
jgi:hypothetical protein